MKTRLVWLGTTMIVFSFPASAQQKLSERKKADAPEPHVEVKRSLHDSDGDGWCDLWCNLFQVEHRNKKQDTDGDGVTDFEEMLAMTNPTMAPLRPATPKEISTLKKNKKILQVMALKSMDDRRKKLEPYLVEGDDEKRTPQELKTARTEKASARLVKVRENQKAKKNANFRRIQKHAHTLGIKAKGIDQNGQVYTLVESGGRIFRKMGSNVISADSISTDEIQPANAILAANGLGGGGSSGLDLTGAGQRFAIWDENDVFGNHAQLSGNVLDENGNQSNRVIDKDGFAEFNDHSTHVAGTLIGNGAFRIQAKGMSSGSVLDAWDFNNDFIEIPDAINPLQTTTPIRLSNHSYEIRHGWDGSVFFDGQVRYIWRGDTSVDQNEDYFFGFYSEDAQTVDAIAYDSQLWLPVWAAGNERGVGDGPPGNNDHNGHIYFDANNDIQYSNLDRDNDEVRESGYDTLAELSLAKNALTVASTESVSGGYSGPGSVLMSPESAWGPSDDGRIKPDISAMGVDVFSASIFGNGYNLKTGTSMATPAVAGSINLLREHYETSIGDSDEVFASTWKALSIHTSDETGDDDGPDYRFGWGLMNSLRAAELITGQANNLDTFPFVKEINLSDQDFVDFKVKAEGGTPLKVTLCWTDPEGDVPPKALDDHTVAALVNDLDLRVEQGGTTYFPWKLDPANPTAAATRIGDNDRDNVEQVEIDSPIAGEDYIITVTHKGNIVDDANSLASQNISIIISGNLVEQEPELIVTEIVKTGPTEMTAIFQAVVGGEYLVETSSTLTSGSWTTALTNLKPTKDLAAVKLPTGGATRKFWRVKRVE